MEYNLAYYVFLGIFGIALHLIVLYAMRNRLKHNVYFIVILFCMLSSWMILVIAPYYQSIGQLQIVDNLIVISLLVVDLVFFNAYLYYESLLNFKPPLGRFVFFFSIFVFLIGLMLLDVFEVYHSENLFILTYLSGSFASIFVLYVLFKTLKINNHNAVKVDIFAVFLMFIGTIAYTFHGILIYLGIITRFTAESSTIYSICAIFMLGAVLVLGINSHLYGDYIHFLPVQIHTILIYNKAGILAYSQNFSSDKGEVLKQPEMLISGALMAFDGFFKEILGANANLKHIYATGFEFMFAEIPEDKGNIVIITSKANYFIYKSLKKFSQSVPPEIVEIINKAGMRGKYQEELNQLIKKHFPYLIFIEKRK